MSLALPVHQGSKEGRTCTPIIARWHQGNGDEMPSSQVPIYTHLTIASTPSTSNGELLGTPCNSAVSRPAHVNPSLLSAPVTSAHKLHAHTELLTRRPYSRGGGLGDGKGSDRVLKLLHTLIEAHYHCVRRAFGKGKHMHLGRNIWARHRAGGSNA